MPKFRCDQFLSIFLIVCLCVVCGSQNIVAQEKVEQVILELKLVKVAPLPISTATNSAQLISVKQELDNLSAQAIYIYDLDSGAVLYEKNAHQPLSPASTTKMMTAIVADQVFDKSHILTIDQAAFVQGNTMKLRKNESISVHNLLTGLLIASANDAAFTLADHHPSGYTGFIKQMNQEAGKLSLEQTHFENPSGLDQTDHYTTARDLAIIGKKLLDNYFFKQLVATKQTQVIDISGKIIHQLYNTNVLLDNEPGIKGIKTGTTESAGQVLVSFLSKDDKKIIIVVMGSEDRYADTKTIINWLFANYRWHEIPENFYNRLIE